MNDASSKNQKKDVYVGPRALFDPNFIPPNLLLREKELKALGAIMFDGIQESCPVSILLTGMEGIGKTSLARASITNVKALLLPITLKCMYVNCKDRIIDEILFALIQSMQGSIKGINVGMNFYDYNLSQLWSYLKSLIHKLPPEAHVWMFDCIEDLDLQYFLKFVQLGKEVGITTVGNHDAPMKSSAVLPKNVDFHLNLEQMTPVGLYKITTQRLRLAFPFQVSPCVPQAICDYVDNFDAPRPGTCIRVLKDVYPFLKQQKTLSHDILRQACQRQLPSINLDDLQIFNDILDRDVIAQLFIDNIASFFQSGEFYISEHTLEEQYQIAAEMIETPFDPREFQMAVIHLIRTNILRESRIAREKHRKEYLLVPPPDLLKNAVDVVFAGAPS